MKLRAFNKPLQAALLAACTIFIQGCVLAPGMYAGGIDVGSEVLATDANGETVSVQIHEMQMQPATNVWRRVPPTEYFESYVLGPGDVVSVTVWEHPELTIPQGEFRTAEATGNLIDQSGKMFYPYCGYFQAAGLNRAGLRSKLENCLSRVIRNPQIDVRIIKFVSKRVSVGGAVNQPGIVPLQNIPLHLSDLIAAAGGAREDADLRHILLTRKDKTYDLDLKQFTEGGDTRNNPLILAGDTIHVVSGTERKVVVLGEVQRPQTVGLNDSVRNLADALSAASGLSPVSAQSGRILVMRKGNDGPEVHWLKGDDPLSLLVAQAFPLQADDIVYVDQTGIVRWGRVVSQLLPFFSLLNQSSAAATR